MEKNVKTEAKNLPTLKEMLEAGMHFGHETKRWNPTFREFIYTKRGGFHIIDVEKTQAKLKEALEFVSRQAAKEEVIFVGTKRQARDIVREAAMACNSHFIVNRWPGGLLTNFAILSKSIESLKKLEELLNGDISGYSQQDLATLRREWGRLNRLFGGIKYLSRLPGVMIVIDANFEKNAVREAKRIGIPIVAMVDSNTDPSKVDYPIPSNDDAIKSISLIVNSLVNAIKAVKKSKINYEYKDLSKVGIKKEDLKAEKQEIVKKEEVKEEEKPEILVKAKKITVKKKAPKSVKKTVKLKTATKRKKKTVAAKKKVAKK